MFHVCSFSDFLIKPVQTTNTLINPLVTTRTANATGIIKDEDLSSLLHLQSCILKISMDILGLNGIQQGYSVLTKLY